MTRRARGDGGLHWDEHRQRWIATTTIGYNGRGKRVVRKASGRTKTEAKNKLRDLLRDQADGLTAGVSGYTVRLAVEDWLTHGLGRQSAATVTKYRHLCAEHVLPSARGTEAARPVCVGSRSMAGRAVPVPQHPNGAGDPGLLKPSGQEGDGAGPGEAECCGADRRSDRPAGAPVEVPHRRNRSMTYSSRRRPIGCTPTSWCRC